MPCKRDPLLAAGVALLSLGLYLLTLAPGLTWAHDSADGGELAAAARTLGIAHPPGYPTYLLLAHVFTRLPVGEIATRTNLFSALSGAGASALVTLALARRVRLPAALGAGLAFAVSPLLWSQAIVTEVYALNALFGAAILAFLPARASGPRAPPRHAAWQAFALAVTWGLSLGNHPTALFCAPLLLLALWRFSRPGAFDVVAAPAGAGLALGLLVYLYLPLRARASPPINWGNPQTLDRFWWMISGAPYRRYAFALSSEYLLPRLLAWAGLLTRQFTWLGLLAALVGAIALWHTDRRLLYATGATVALCSILALGYDTTDSYLYLIPALVSLALWLGYGLDRLLALDAPPWAKRLKPAMGALFILLPLSAALFRFPAMDLSQDRAARDFQRTVIEQAPPRALVLSQQDNHTFALWYLKVALGRRPDIHPADLDLLAYDWYTLPLSQQLASEPSQLRALSAVQDLGQWSRALNRPVCRIAPDSTSLTCATHDADD